MGESYSHPRWSVRHTMTIAEDITLNGTIASAAEICRVTAFTNIKLKDWNIAVITGGTAAGPSITIGKSAGGTGAVTAIGTASFGTNADNTVIDGSLTETSFSAGDDIVIKSVAGTAASTPKFNIYVDYVEEFTNA
ncbi:MAG: hypothetical protein DRH51_05890 [Candidatus Coatesbacteria bacterium]|nr:MAG: hypothetical protein DRH51_05890 [Candidatus Coatesbacteria bacterium]